MGTDIFGVVLPAQVDVRSLVYCFSTDFLPTCQSRAGDATLLLFYCLSTAFLLPFYCFSTAFLLAFYRRANRERVTRLYCFSTAYLVRLGTIWYDLVRFGTVWYDLVQFGTFWYDLVPTCQSRARDATLLLFYCFSTAFLLTFCGFLSPCKLHCNLLAFA